MTSGSNGVIYVPTNPSFPEYVKIGYADNLEKRLSDLNRSECLPFAFRAYCIYEVNERLKDKDVHALIDKINPELRAIETFDGKPRVREFYNISAEDAYDILYSIAAISGTTKRLKHITPEGHEVIDEHTKLYVAFKKTAPDGKKPTNVCDIEIQRNKLKITANIRHGKIDDPYGIARDISEIGHWGNGDYEIHLTDDEMLTQALDIIMQSYRTAK